MVCACADEQPVVKLIRDKITGYPAGYGFLEFQTQRGAQNVLETFNGQLIRKINYGQLYWLVYSTSIALLA